jgi:hypothetical protein
MAPLVFVAQSDNINMKTSKKDLVLIRLCHKCGHIHESENELEKCEKCGKGFLPLQYFEKVHAQNTSSFRELFSPAKEIDKEDLLKGLFVLW